jgi:hypothetical protein
VYIGGEIMTSDIEKLSKAINYLEYYIVDSGVQLNFVAEQSLKTLKDYIQKHSNDIAK